jgi:hypothetical protein
VRPARSPAICFAERRGNGVAPSGYTSLGATLAAFAAILTGCEWVAGLGDAPPAIVAPSDAAPEAQGSDADAAAVWAPSALPGLVLWLDAEKGLTVNVPGASSVVQSWLDQSGWANDAQSMGFVTVRPNAIGGRPALHFDGATAYLVVTDSPSLQFGTGDFAVAMVVQHTTPTSNGYGFLYCKTDLNADAGRGFALGANSVPPKPPFGELWAQVSFGSQAVITTTENDFNTGRPFYVIVHRFGNNMNMLVNGVGAAAGLNSFGGDVSEIQQNVVIGGSNLQQDLVGDIAEVIAVKGTTSPVDIQNLNSYLKTKYSF